MNQIDREQVVEDIAARLPGAVRKARAANVLRALETAGYEVVRSDWRDLLIYRLEAENQRLLLGLKRACEDSGYCYVCDHYLNIGGHTAGCPLRGAA